LIRLTFATKHRIFASTLWLTALVSAGAVVLDWRAKRQQVFYAEDSHWDSPNLAPFVTAPHEVVSRMLELAQIEKGDAFMILDRATVESLLLRQKVWN